MTIAGGRNPERQRELAGRVLDHLLSGVDSDASFRGLAAAAGVSRPTLVHHFGDRRGVLQAVLAQAGERAQPWIRQIAEGPEGPPDPGLAMMLRWLALAWPESLGPLHRLGLRLALADPDAAGAMYRQALVEPMLAAFAARLRRHHERGELHVPDPEPASWSLAWPVVAALLDPQRSNDIGAFIDAHARGFLRGYSARSSATISL